jgi:hypothetical protein
MGFAIGAIVTGYDHVEKGQNVASRMCQREVITVASCDDGQFHHTLQLGQGLPDERS